MHDFAILTNRKRAKIALIHSVVFLLIAMRGVANANVVRPIWTSPAVSHSTMALIAIYLIVSTVLVVLVRVSRCLRERIYFILCATSASVGLLRYIFGDPVLHAGLYVRVLLLTAAVIMCSVILRLHSAKSLAMSEA